MFEHDTVLIPKETAWFGYYPDGAFKPVLLPEQTQLFTEDWIGLKTLHDARRVKYISVPGNHLGISRDDMKKYVVPYLEDQASPEGSMDRADGVHPRSSESHNLQKQTSTAEEMIEGSASSSWPSSVKTLFQEILGFVE